MPRGGDQQTAHAAVLRAVQDYLIVRGAWQCKIWGSMMMRAGLPDVLAILHGRAIGIECKTGNAVLSVRQQAERAAIERAGGLFIIVHVIEDLEDTLLQAGIVDVPILLVREPRAPAAATLDDRGE
jgi:hypothetical protein